VADIEHQLGKVLMRKGRLDDARDAFVRVLAARDTGEPGREYAKTVHELARIHHLQHDLDRARELYLQALDLERRRGDFLMEQATLFQLGKLQLELEDIEAADQHFHESRQISLNLGDKIWMIHGEYGLALIAWARGDRAKAASMASSAIRQADELQIGLAREIREWSAGINLFEGAEVLD
jgi:tetratricopeptide (TPR) repeat protein